MNPRPPLRITTLFAALCAAASCAAAAPLYRVVDTGLWTGTLSAINESGVATGQSPVGSQPLAAVRWRAGTTTALPDLGDGGWGYAINKSGAVAGERRTTENFEYIYHATLWTPNGKAHALGTLGGRYAYAFGINDARHVVGMCATANDEFGKACGWTGANGVAHDLGAPGYDSWANDINNRDQIVGTAQLGLFTTAHAFLWQDGQITDLGTLGGSESDGVAINDAGHIVGSSQYAGNKTRRAFLYANGRMRNLGTIDGESEATAINSTDVVVGVSHPHQAEDIAWVWRDGSMQRLADVVDVPGWTFRDVRSVNDAGAILAGGTYQGAYHWVVLQPL